MLEALPGLVDLLLLLLLLRCAAATPPANPTAFRLAAADVVRLNDVDEDATGEEDEAAAASTSGLSCSAAKTNESGVLAAGTGEAAGAVTATGEAASFAGVLICTAAAGGGGGFPPVSLFGVLARAFDGDEATVALGDERRRTGATCASSTCRLAPSGV